jgi:nucleoside-diphosphate-sugar epimerase
VWGDGSAIRAFTYVEDLVDGIYRLMHSDLEDGVNIGRQEYVTVDELATLAMEVAGKKLKIEHVEGPVGVQARYFTDDRIRSTGWTSKISLREGLSRTYPWILQQVEAAKE